MAKTCNLQHLNSNTAWRNIGKRPKDFVSRLLVLEEKDRMLATDAKNHAWFSNEFHCLDFEAVYQRAIKHWEPKSSKEPIVETITEDKIHKNLDEPWTYPQRKPTLTASASERSESPNVPSLATEKATSCTLPRAQAMNEMEETLRFRACGEMLEVAKNPPHTAGSGPSEEKDQSPSEYAALQQSLSASTAKMSSSETTSFSGTESLVEDASHMSTKRVSLRSGDQGRQAEEIAQIEKPMLIAETDVVATKPYNHNHCPQTLGNMCAGEYLRSSIRLQKCLRNPKIAQETEEEASAAHCSAKSLALNCGEGPSLLKTGLLSKIGEDAEGKLDTKGGNDAPVRTSVLDCLGWHGVQPRAGDAKQETGAAEISDRVRCSTTTTKTMRCDAKPIDKNVTDERLKRKISSDKATDSYHRKGLVLDDNRTEPCCDLGFKNLWDGFSELYLPQGGNPKVSQSWKRR